MRLPKLFSKRRDPRTEAMMQEASTLGRQSFLQQQARAISALSNVSGADEIQDNPNEMLAIELPFMWGWYLAFAEDQGEWPTTPDQRATAHMIRYCMDHYGMDFDQARAEGSSLDQMWNEADPLFEAFRKKGQEAYLDPQEPLLAQVIAHVANFRRESPQ